MAVFFWYPVKVGASVRHCTVAYTGQDTFYKVPKIHGNHISIKKKLPESRGWRGLDPAGEGRHAPLVHRHVELLQREDRRHQQRCWKLRISFRKFRGFSLRKIDSYKDFIR